MDRIQKIIAASGICSRRKAEELIKEGKVKVNGVVVSELGYKASSDDVISVNDEKVSVEHKVYYMLNKPRGVISAVTDDKGRDTVVELIDEKNRIFPIGRLDYDTTGLILLTNDGDLANILMHPKNNVPKTYVAKIEGLITMDEFYKIKEGIVIDGSKVIPKKIKLLSKDTLKKTTLIRIIVAEGKNHMVKKMFESVNHSVIKLKREAYGPLTLKGLNSGEYRHLSLEEIECLYSYKK